MPSASMGDGATGTARATPVTAVCRSRPGRRVRGAASVGQFRHLEPGASTEQRPRHQHAGAEPFAAVRRRCRRAAIRPCGRTAAGAVRRRRSADRRLPTERPISVSPRSRDRRRFGAQHGERDVLDRLGRGGRVRQRARPSRPREVVVAEAQGDRPTDPVGATHPARHPIDDREQGDLDVVGATSGGDPSPTATRSNRGGDRPRPAGGRGCGRARGVGGHRPTPRMARRLASPTAATSPTVNRPRSWSLRSVTGPTPHRRPTGSGCRNSSSWSGSTTSSPSGLATPLATLARNFVRAMPTVIGKPDLLEHRRHEAGGRSRPVTPRSDARRPRRGTPRRSTAPRRCGVTSWNTSNTRLLASVYASKRGGTTTRSGQARRARCSGIGDVTPRRLAS